MGGVDLLIDDGARAYLHADGVQAEIDSGSTRIYHLTDGLGSVRGLTDPNANLTGTVGYSVFGEMRSQSGATSRFGFTGEQHDSLTGNLYLRARYLMPGIGRFSSADSVQPNAPGSQGYNRYSYVANNPTTWSDPTGHYVGALVAAGELQLSEFFYQIGAAIARFFLLAACATGCIIAIVAIIIIAFIVLACVFGAFGGACFVPTTEREIETRTIKKETTQTDPAPWPDPQPKPRREIGWPPQTDRTRHDDDDPSCRDVANSGEWYIQLPSVNPRLRDHLVGEGHAPGGSGNKGRWNQESWNNLDQRITDAMEQGIVMENPSLDPGDSDCAAFFSLTTPSRDPINVGTDGSGDPTNSYVVYFDLPDGYIRTTYPEGGGFEGIR